METTRPNAHAFNFAPEYGEAGLSDHLPMTAVALERLGAGGDRIRDFKRMYRDRLDRLEHVPVKNRAGLRNTYAERLRDNFEILNVMGCDKFLRWKLPKLVSGIGTGAFHAAIRTAYGIEAEDYGEVAAGISYWETAFLDLALTACENSPLAGLLPLEQLIAVRGAVQAGRLESVDEDLITDDLECVLAQEGARMLFGGVLIDLPPDWTAIAKAALAIYFASDGNFTALHCVTATHASRILARKVDEDDEIRRNLWSAILVAYATIGAPDTCSLEAEERELSWASILNAASKSQDEHDIKFAYTCFEEAQQYPSLQFQDAAMLRLRNLL